MFGRARALLLVGACALAMPAAAETATPTTTAFDGTYFGSRTFEATGEGQTWHHGCPTTTELRPLTIVNGVARTLWAGPVEGSVTPEGILVMRAPQGVRFDGQIDNQGTVKGRMTGAFCNYQLVWHKAPASTTAFDGKYTGVSRESAQNPSAPSAKCPSSGVPAALTITNGIVTGGPWQGNVNPQGRVMINASSVQLTAQIDGQGLIRGQANDAAGCAMSWVWRKQAG